MSMGKTEIETFFGKCRCCLSYGYLRNMWAEHQFEGEAEIYGEMLVECFALTWDHSEDSMEQDQICERCICRLRDATDFKRVVLDSQAELFQQIDAENDVSIKEETLDEELLVEYPHSEERLDEELLIEYPHAESEDTAHTTFIDTEHTIESAYTMPSVKDEAEYEEVEYLEDEDGGRVDDAVDTDSSQPTDRSSRAKRRKQSSKQDTDDEKPSKQKWPKKLPKSERHKTYKQYSEIDLRKCLEEVRSNVLTAAEAALKYDIPKKTICAKVKDPNDVRKDIQNSINHKTTHETVTTSQIEVPTLSHGETTQTDIESQEVRNKYPLSHEEAKETDSDTESQEVPNKFLMFKHKNNLKIILKYSNATLIKGNSAAGYSCWFCDEQFNPEQLKKHNFDHGDVYDDAIKVKYVSDLIIKLDVTGLKCRLCEEEIESLEALMAHFQEDHKKTVFTDIDNHFIPFKFDTDELQCVICAAEFKHFKLLSEHMCEHYSNYSCPECDRVFINKQSMQTHSYRHKKGQYKCSQCPKIFDSPMKIREHEYVTHKLSNKKRKCGFCDEKFSSEDLVKNHESSVHGVARSKFTCEACNRTFISQKSLATHQKRHHLLMRPIEYGNTIKSNNIMSVKKRSNSEIEATKVTETKKGQDTERVENEKEHSNPDDQRFLYKHKDNIKVILQNSNATLIKSYGRDGYLCNFCDFQAEKPFVLKQHNLKKHTDIGDEVIKTKYVSDLMIKLDTTDFKCKLCNDPMNTLEDFITHLSVTHSKLIYTDVKNYIIPFKFDSDDFRCFMCDKNFKYFKLLSEHMTEHYRNFECTVCERSFINKQSMQTHSYRHKKGIFKCSFCSKEFDCRPKRVDHERAVHMDGKFRKCAHCEQRVPTWDALLEHEFKAHGVAKPTHTCEDCGKTYSKQSCLTMHKNRFHLFRKPHKCSFCEMAFCTKVELSYHVITHTKTRNHRCEICKKTFGTPITLSQHMRTHANAKKLFCDYCERRFLKRTTFRRHMRETHGKIV